MGLCSGGNKYIYLCASIACLSSILLGYDIGVMSGAIIYMEKDIHLDKIQVEVIVSFLSFFSIIGALIGGQLAATFGRKKTIALSAFLFFTGTIIMIMTKVFGIILFGRILLGIATGLGLLIAPLYTAEISPSSMRGKLVALSEISINTGMLFGYFIAWIFYFMHNDEAWRIMISFGCVPSILLFLGMCIMPESPRWLIEQNQISEAAKVLQKITTMDEVSKFNKSISESSPLKKNKYDSDRNQNANADESTTELSKREAVIQNKIKEIQKTIALETNHCDSDSSWGQLFLPCIFKPSLLIRKALLVGCGIAFFQQSTGIDAVVYYTPLVFRDLGLNDEQILLYTTIMGLVKGLFIVAAILMLDRIGRKPLLMASSVLMLIALVGLTLSFSFGRPAGLTVFLQCFYVSSFSLGWGPVCWVMISEIFPLQIRSKGMAVATCVNRFMAGIVALFFLSIKEWLTPSGVWILFACLMILAMWFVVKKVPETKNKSLEEITNALMHGVKHWVVTDTDHDQGLTSAIDSGDEQNQMEMAVN